MEDRMNGAAASDETVATQGGDADIETPDLATLAEELERLKQESAEYLDQFQRARAELANVRRRMEQEQERVRQRATERLASKLLPVVDDFGRALRAVPPEISGNGWFEGVRLIERKLWNALETEGVAEIESAGRPFDPATMEAVAVDESAGKADTVVEVFQPGYYLGGTVLRPAIVKVGAAQQADAGSDAAKDTQ